ncbi:PPC domain-containing DNA-binding protein [Caldanaerobius polysaccharolyticus]|uniref:PPC domain-containing DNA-binding protein n=1 Tax=Caldanaerobius polysaccharolyticus TaxID=44256 RepID=UPI00047AB685|nr:PPC domain-containing DNA-binding protein [Caldanaerobius polysaccharolyticus]
MEYFTAPKIGRVFVLRLDQGDYVLESINDFIKKENIKDAVVVSAIGTLDYCVLHMVTTTGYPAVEHFERWEDKPLELSSIDGVIADGKPHLHAVVSDKEKAYSGHLEEGCRVLYLAEIVIVELVGANLSRIYDENHILKLSSNNK